MHINNNFKYLLQNNNTNTFRLSKEVNIDESTLRRIRNGQINNPSIETVVMICSYFKVSLDDFVHKDLSKDK